MNTASNINLIALPNHAAKRRINYLARYHGTVSNTLEIVRVLALFCIL